MQREPYWEYMGRRLKEERLPSMSETDLLKKEISQMQSQIQYLMTRVKDLKQEVDKLSKYQPEQLELF